MAVVLEVGIVPDEVLLRCGKPDGMPSRSWTPWLAEASAEDAAALRAAADQFLVEEGVLDPESGVLSGALGVVSEVVSAATLVVAWEGQVPGGELALGAFVAAGDRVLVDRQDVVDGSHQLYVVDPQTAVAWLADGIDPGGVAGGGVTTEIRRVGAEDVAEALEAIAPTAARRWTLRCARVMTGDVPGVGPGGLAHGLTVFATDDAVHAAWAAPEGGLLVQSLDADGVVETALALLGAEVAEAVS